MSQTAIEVNNLSVCYGQKVILSNIKFDIPKGQFVGIMGRSGVGKSTLLNALVNFVPYTGSVKLEGKVGFCYQKNSLFSWMTVFENLTFGLDLISKIEKNKIVDEILERIELKGLGKQYPHELSGGQQQRVQFGRMIAHKNSIWLLDEPFSSLDLITRDLMIKWVSTLLSEYNITALLVSHYIDEVLALCQRVLIIKNGIIRNDLSLQSSAIEDSTKQDNYLLQKNDIYQLLYE